MAKAMEHETSYTFSRVVVIPEIVEKVRSKAIVARTVYEIQVVPIDAYLQDLEVDEETTFVKVKVLPQVVVEIVANVSMVAIYAHVPLVMAYVANASVVEVHYGS